MKHDTRSPKVSAVARKNIMTPLLHLLRREWWISHFAFESGLHRIYYDLQRISFRDLVINVGIDYAIFMH